MFGAGRAVPLIDTAIHAVFVMCQPQLRSKAGEADEEGGVKKALPTEERVAPTPYETKPKTHDKRAGFPYLVIDHRFSVDGRRRPIRESKPHSYVPGFEMNSPSNDELNPARGTTQQSRNRDSVGQRCLLVHHS